MTDIRNFFFYDEYEWQAGDFEDFQTWLDDRIKKGREGAFGSSALSGLKTVPLSGMTIRVSAGIAVNSSGYVMAVDSDSDLTISSPAGNPAKTLVVLRPKLTNTDNIPEPLNPSNPVPLHQIQGSELVVLNGTPAPSPVYPTPQSGDVVLCGLILSSGHATIVAGDFDLIKRHTPRQQELNIGVVAAEYQMTGNEDIVECNGAASGFTVLVPSNPNEVQGKKFVVMKTDSSANVIHVSGSTMSGQTDVQLTDQWQSVEFYSNLGGWRIL